MILENEEECIAHSKVFLEENYVGLERRLKDGEIASFTEFEKNIQNFEAFFMEHGPPGTSRREILLSFVAQKTSAASDFFIKNLSNEVTIQKTISDEHIAKL